MSVDGSQEPFRTLVLQWAHEGRADELAEVEDHLTAIARDHAVEVTRERGGPLRHWTDGPPPDEVHVLTFADEAGFDAFLADERRAAWSARLGAVMARTLVVRLHRW